MPSEVHEHEAQDWPGNLWISAGGHGSGAKLTDEQIAFIDELVAEGAGADSHTHAETRAEAARWAIETVRQTWMAEGNADGGCQ